MVAILETFLFVLGVAFLWKGADLLVDGASAIAMRLQVSPLVIGLTVVSFGTSAPELAVNAFAASRGVTDLALGNVLGSNIANTLLVLGAAAVVRELAVTRQTVRVEIPITAIATLILALLLNDQILEGRPNLLGRGDGLVLLVLFCLFLYYMWYMMRNSRPTTEQVPELGMGKATLWVVLGALGLGFGAEWIVDGARLAATAFDVSPALLGLTVVALGTSLPELVTSVVAAKKGSADIAVGNVVGSNIFNIFWIMGITATLSPVMPDPDTNIDLLVAGASALVLMVLVMVPKSDKLDRGEGLTLLIGYALYMVALFTRL